ncbi:hypothetical protein [Streptomyces triticagri]|uniref:hypothetical protein n=1 Tax=Streptomyces triticagri TaxID=2293568 RepID=UPI001314F9EE|nr:hypothetical protein [Streptomyces triticagri]
MTHAADHHHPAARTPRRGRRGVHRSRALAVAGSLLASAALGACGGADGTAGESPVRTETPKPSDSPVGEIPATDVTGKRLKRFYDTYLDALDGPSGGPERLRKQRLSAHYLDDLGDSRRTGQADAVTGSRNTPAATGKVGHDSTIDNHSWFLVDLKWKDGKVPTEESGAPDEPEYSPTQVRVQIDRDTQKISDVEVQEREPGPGQPEEPPA